MEIYSIPIALILIGLIYLAVWAGEHLADCQDEIEVKEDRKKALRSL